MKKIITTVILTTILYGSQAFAQDVLLPFSESWSAKYFYAKIGEETPDPNWYDADFDDSVWNELTGPVYRSTNWKEEYSTFWLRRHFTIDDANKYHEFDFVVTHDDGCVAYLNGHPIYSFSGVKSSKETTSFYQTTDKILRNGDNVLAVLVSDTGGGDAFVNFGLYAYEDLKKYAELRHALDSLQQSINAAKSDVLPRTVVEATQLLSKINRAVENYEYTNEEAVEQCSIINSLISRLGYSSIDISVPVPGSMGDSILSKVENFSDVISIKLSGQLNDTDISTIQSRLTNLREIDLTDVKMETLPNRLFYQHRNLQKVFLPKSLITIGEYAFYQCYAINYIEFPVTLTTINRYGFSECDNLQEVILPEGFNSLGDYAFHSCDNNKRVKLPSTLKSISSYAFYHDLNLRNVEFSEGLTHIYYSAFGDCSVLNNLKFPSTLYYIDNSAFTTNRSLSNIEFNEGLYQIADNAFYDCDALTEVTLPGSLVLAYASPFDYCDNLRKVTCLSIEPPYMIDQIPYGLEMDGRELYVPALSINTYKQTAGWEKFPVIKPIEYLPEKINVVSDLKLTLPTTIPADYKPDVDIIHDQKGTSYWQYGSLTVNGEGTLSISDFSIVWDPNYQYVQYSRNQNNCSLVNNSHLRADNVSVYMYTRNDRWNFISFPFDVKMSDILTISAGTTNWVVRKYDGQKRAAGETSDTWVKVGGDETLNAGEGYIIQGSRYIDTDKQDHSGFYVKAINNTNKNNIFLTTDITVKLNVYESEFAHNRSWNFIGNPYPCYYDTRFIDFEAPITVWNMRNNTYEAYSPSDDSYILCPGEAFFVQCPIDKGNIVFSKDGRQTNRDVRTIAYTRAQGTNAANTSRTIVNLSLSDGKNTDRTRIVLNNESTLQYEMDKDASKFMSTDTAVPQLYTSSEGVNYAINERPLADKTVNLCAYIGAEGLYTIALTNNVEGYNIILEDKTTNKSIILTDENRYTFSAEAGTYTNRFVLHFGNEATGIKEIRSKVNDDSTIYSIEGIRMATPTKKGIYIQKGKKILMNK